MKTRYIMAALLLVVAGLQTTKAQKMRFHYAGQDTPVEYSFAGLDSMVFVDAPDVEPEYVDLGLPSGTLWATFNVGASRPEDYGNYFAWGETTTKKEYSWSTYKYCEGSSNTLTKYCYESDYGYNGFTDTLTELLPEDDAATANWGSEWQMPSQVQFGELINDNYTITVWTTQNGVNGRKITSKRNGNSIFLPAAGCRDDYGVGTYGYYWSRSLYGGGSYGACNTDFASSHFYVTVYGSRYNGFSVRPVRKQEPKEVLVESITLNETELRIELPYENEVSRQLTATILPSNATNKTLEWESSNEAVAKVSANGRMTAVGWGNCIITCRATDGSGVYAECRVKVVDPVL